MGTPMNLMKRRGLRRGCMLAAMMRTLLCLVEVAHQRRVGREDCWTHQPSCMVYQGPRSVRVLQEACRQHPTSEGVGSHSAEPAGRSVEPRRAGRQRTSLATSTVCSSRVCWPVGHACLLQSSRVCPMEVTQAFVKMRRAIVQRNGSKSTTHLAGWSIQCSSTSHRMRCAHSSGPMAAVLQETLRREYKKGGSRSSISTSGIRRSIPAALQPWGQGGAAPDRVSQR